MSEFLECIVAGFQFVLFLVIFIGTVILIPMYFAFKENLFGKDIYNKYLLKSIIIFIYLGILFGIFFYFYPITG